MARRLMLWLKDEEMREYERRAEELGVDFNQLGTLLVCRWLALEEVPTGRKKRARWLEEHKLETQLEFLRSGSTTELRVSRMLEDGEVMATPQIREALGWKSAGGLSELLSNMSGVTETNEPEGWVRKRGTQPKFWQKKEVGSSS